MAWQKTKVFIVSAFKEGSFSIITLTISTLIVLALNPNPLTDDIFKATYLIGFILTFGIIIFRIILNQYVIFKLRMDKLKSDLIKGDYSDLAQDTLQTAIKPIINDLAVMITEKITKETRKEQTSGEPG